MLLVFGILAGAHARTADDMFAQAGGPSPHQPSRSLEQPHAERERDDELIDQLRERIAILPEGDIRRQGLMLLGNAERSRGRIAEAAAAFAEALASRFDPNLAADLSELLLDLGETARASGIIAQALALQPNHAYLRFLHGLAEEAAGRLSAARAAWQALLDDAPPNAPWRAILEGRIRNLQ